MRTTRFFIVGILCLVFSLQGAYSQTLTTKVSVKVENATLPQVLQQIQQKYGFRFSYLNNDMPAELVFSAEVKDKPLAEVLDVLLEKTDFGYQENKGQIIIKRGFPKNKPKATTFQALPAAAPAAVPPPTVPPGKSQAAARAEKEQEMMAASPAKIAVPAQEPQAKSIPAAPVRPATPDQVEALVEPNAFEREEELEAPPVDASAEAAAGEAADPKPSFLQKIKKIDLLKNTDFSFPKGAAASGVPGDSIAYRDFHLGVVYPLSTNGRQAHRFVNHVSVHLLTGIAAGLNGAEYAGIGNFTRSYARGVQFAGLFNIVQNAEEHQDLVRTRNRGYTVNGAQFSGFLNIAAGDVRGAQVAGSLNLMGDGQGGQFAGFMNVARDVKGAQVAGFMNTAREVDVQVGGFLNLAKHMRGAQIGVINIADSASGVPIGLLSLVRKNGYNRVELYYADDFHANLTIKLGVRKFHNLLALGVELEGPQRWGFGYGIGSEHIVFPGFRINTDLLGYYLVERGFDDFPLGFRNNDQLNLLGKFRLLGSIQLGRRLALFGGPTFNVSVSEFQEPGLDKIGSSFGRNHFYDRTFSDATNVKMWLGFNAGLRF
jgi:hypothetical protein